MILLGEDFETQITDQISGHVSVVADNLSGLKMIPASLSSRPHIREIILSHAREVGSLAKATSPSLQMNACAKNFRWTSL